MPNASSSSSTRKSSGNNAVDDAIIAAKLAEGAYHIPGNTWFQDWVQYFRNNHPVFAVCCQHKLHPMEKKMRAVALFGSVVAGLVITNIIWLMFFYGKETNNMLVVSASGVTVRNTTKVTFLDENAITDYTKVEVNNGMIVLWTVGALVHGLFDSCLWFLATIQCKGRLAWLQKYKGFANIFIVIFVLLVTAFATMIVVVRSTLNNNPDVDVKSLRLAGITDDQIDFQEVKDPANYEFLLAYTIELALAWFLYFPIVETINFSGILNCKGKVPCLGGRPYEVQQELRTQRTSTSRDSHSYP